MSTMYVVKLVSAYSIIALFAICVVILLIMIVHLCSKLKQKRKSKSKQRELQFFLLISIVAIICFEITLCLIIAVATQIILIDAHALHQDVHWFDHLYYDSFEYMEYSIAIFDTLGHLCVILVFIARFQITFQRNTLFQSQKTLITILYSILCILFVAAVVIVILMSIKHTVAEIIIIEIIWEILVDIMCLWILYLFMSKLYALLKLSIQSHMSHAIHNNKDSLLKHIIEATRQTITESKSEHSKSGSTKLSGKSKSRNKSGSRKNKSKNKLKTGTEKSKNYTMTIDGMKVEPHPSPGPNNSKPGTANNSRDPTPDPLSNNEQTQTVNYHPELTVTVANGNLPLNNSPKPSDNEQTDNEQTDHEDNIGNKEQSAAIDLIGVMTKMTLLVTLAVFVSVFGVIGNVFIEIQEMKHIEHHDIAIEELWADVLPALDVLITSLMLYLQFNFTHKVYRFFLRRLDVWFLQNCLKCIECIWKRRLNNDTVDEKKASFLVENSTRTKTLELVTKTDQQTV